LDETVAPTAINRLAALSAPTPVTYIGGGIVPRLGQFFSDSNFLNRFEHKGRLANYLSQIPTFVITEPYPAFIGISALLAQA